MLLQWRFTHSLYWKIRSHSDLTRHWKLLNTQKTLKKTLLGAQLKSKQRHDCKSHTS